MTIYADTSFLVSYLYPGDTSHNTARTFFQNQPQSDWLTSAWSEFETINTLRQLCVRTPPASREGIEAIRLLFKHWHKAGPFREELVDYIQALIDCRKLSAAYGSSSKMRSADALHVAILEQLNPDAFVTRDSDQFNLAQSRGFNCQLVT